MARNQPPTIDDNLRLKSWPWWRSEIGHKLTADGRQLLQDCGVPAQNVETHIRHVRDAAWEVFPFPCIGSFWFIEFGISRHPHVGRVISLLQKLDAQSSCPNPSFFIEERSGMGSSVIERIVQNPDFPRLVDLGTCVGQDLRMLRSRGVPASILYGSDLYDAFEGVGHQLFLDEDTFGGHFFTSDVMDNSEQSALNKTAGMWDVVTMSMFTHQFNLEQQRSIARRSVTLLRQRRGSMILGTSTGQTTAGDLTLKPPFGDGTRTVYRQSKETMCELWEQAVNECGEVAEDWNIMCVYDEQEMANRERERLDKGEIRFFTGDGQRRIYFTIERK